MKRKEFKISRHKKYTTHNLIIRYLVVNFFNKVGSLLSNISFESMLDVGCGEGILLAHIREDLVGKRVFAMDISPIEIETAKKNIPFANCIVGSIYRLPYVVQANMLALEKDKANYEVFNVGSGVARSIKSIAEPLAKLCQVDISAEITGKFRKGDVRHCFSDISKIKDKLGFKPAISFEVGMKELIEWSDKEPSTDKFEQAYEELKEKGLI